MPFVVVVECRQAARGLAVELGSAGSRHDTVVRNAPGFRLLVGAQEFDVTAHKVPPKGISIVGIVDIHTACPLSVGRNTEKLVFLGGGENDILPCPGSTLYRQEKEKEQTTFEHDLFIRMIEKKGVSRDTPQNSLINDIQKIWDVGISALSP